MLSVFERDFSTSVKMNGDIGIAEQQKSSLISCLLLKVTMNN